MSTGHSEEQVEVVDGIEYRYSAEWTEKLEDEFHWRLYWRQQKAMEGLFGPGDELMEIGPGTGFTSNYLRSRGFKVTTVDIDERKQPDIVTNIVTYPFDTQYDGALAFEVFEHIPFDKCREVVPRIAAACRKALVFSVPRHTKTAFRFDFKLPKMKPRSWQWSVRRGQPMSKYHFWEIGYNGVSMEDVKRLIADSGLQLVRCDEAFDRMFFSCVKS